MLLRLHPFCSSRIIRHHGAVPAQAVVPAPIQKPPEARSMPPSVAATPGAGGAGPATIVGHQRAAVATMPTGRLAAGGWPGGVGATAGSNRVFVVDFGWPATVNTSRRHFLAPPPPVELRRVRGVSRRFLPHPHPSVFHFVSGPSALRSLRTSAPLPSINGVFMRRLPSQRAEIAVEARPSASESRTTLSMCLFLSATPVHQRKITLPSRAVCRLPTLFCSSRFPVHCIDCPPLSALHLIVLLVFWSVII